MLRRASERFEKKLIRMPDGTFSSCRFCLDDMTIKGELVTEKTEKAL